MSKRIMAYFQRDDPRMARKKTHNFAERERITLAPTVGSELGKRRFAQRFLVVPW
jgi:hypothetical protein